MNTDCSIEVKAMLFRAALKGYGGPDSTLRAHHLLGKALVWLCDSLESDLNHMHPRSKHHRKHIVLLRVAAGDMAKRLLDESELLQARAECDRLLAALPD